MVPYYTCDMCFGGVVLNSGRSDTKRSAREEASKQTLTKLQEALEVLGLESCIDLYTRFGGFSSRKEEMKAPKAS